MSATRDTRPVLDAHAFFAYAPSMAVLSLRPERWTGNWRRDIAGPPTETVRRQPRGHPVGLGASDAEAGLRYSIEPLDRDGRAELAGAEGPVVAAAPWPWPFSRSLL
jgi:hypothetical protein